MDDATIFLIHILDKNISYKRLNQICNDINLYAMLLFRRHIWSLDGIKLHLFSETGIFQQTDYSSHNDQFPSLFGCLRFGDNIEDEWIVVTFLLHLTSHFRCLAAEIRDNDGQFLLIECADFIPIWIKPDTSQNRIFIYRGEVHIIPHPKTPSEIPLIPINPTKQQSLQILKLGYVDTHASQQAQLQIIKRIKPYLKYQENEKKIILPIQQLSLQLSLPQSLYHTSIVSLPISIAKVLYLFPQFISHIISTLLDFHQQFNNLNILNSEQFIGKENMNNHNYNRIIVRLGHDSCPFAHSPRVLCNIRIPRFYFAQLNFLELKPPKGWIMPQKDNKTIIFNKQNNNSISFPIINHASEIGLKITEGVEILRLMKEKKKQIQNEKKQITKKQMNNDDEQDEFNIKQRTEQDKEDEDMYFNWLNKYGNPEQENLTEQILSKLDNFIQEEKLIIEQNNILIKDYLNVEQQEKEQIQTENNEQERIIYLSSPIHPQHQLFNILWPDETNQQLEQQSEQQNSNQLIKKKNSVNNIQQINENKEMIKSKTEKVNNNKNTSNVKLEETTSDEIKEQEDDDEEEEDLITDVFAFDVKQHHKDIIEVDQEDKYDINEDQLQKKDSSELNISEYEDNDIIRDDYINNIQNPYSILSSLSDEYNEQDQQQAPQLINNENSNITTQLQTSTFDLPFNSFIQYKLSRPSVLYDNQSEQWLYINEDDVDKEIQQSGMLGVDTNKRIMNNEDKQDKQQKIDIDEDQEMVDISKKIINKTQKYIDSKSSVFGVEDPKETSNKQEKKEKIKKIESQQQESIKMGIASTLSQKEKDEVRRWLQSDDDQENGGSINNGNNKDEKQREKNKDRILNKDQIQNLLISFFDEDEGFENWMKQSVENEKGKQNNIIEGLDQLDEEQEDEVDEDEDDEDEDEDDDSQNEDEDEELEAMMQVMQGELQNNPSYSAGFETDVVSDDDYEEQEDIKLDKQKSKQNKTKNQINAEANLISGFMSSIESQGAAPGPTNVILGQLTDEALKIRRKAKKKK